MSNSPKIQGGIAPPQGLILKARSNSRTLWPASAISCAAVAPDGRHPQRSHRSLFFYRSWVDSPELIFECKGIVNVRVFRIGVHLLINVKYEAGCPYK